VSVDVVPAFVSALWCASKSDPWVWFSDDWRVAIFVLHNRPTRCRPMVDPSSIDEGTELLSPFTHGARCLDVTEVALFDPYAAAVGGRARAEVRADGQPQP